MQGKRTRALDSRGRPVKGIYVRDGRFIAGFQCPQTHRWRMQDLDAETITDARKERASLLAGLREARVAAPDRATFNDIFLEYQSARALSDRTTKHERHLVDRHLADMKDMRAQDITASHVARLLSRMRSSYSEWTRVAVYRLLRGSFEIAVKRGVVMRSPMDGLAASERPKQRNKKKIAVLDSTTMNTLIDTATSERWRAALALAGYAGLRLGEIRALTWGDVDLDNNIVIVRRSMLPDGTAKPPKNGGGSTGDPDAARVATCPRPLADPISAHPTERPDRLHRRPCSRAGTQYPPCARGCEDRRRTGWWGAASVDALAAPLLCVDAGDRLGAPGDHAGEADGSRERRIHAQGLRPRQPRDERDRRGCACPCGRRRDRNLTRCRRSYVPASQV
jgi:hypothetical protein